MTESILEAAHGLVFGDRGDAYDHPAVDYQRAVDIFNAITGCDLTAAEGIVFMKAVKLSRLGRALQAGFPAEAIRDTITDDAGYTECLWQTLTYEPE